MCSLSLTTCDLDRFFLALVFSFVKLDKIIYLRVADGMKCVND